MSHDPHTSWTALPYLVPILLGWWRLTSQSSLCLLFPSNPVSSVSSLLNLIANGVLPQAAWPPQDIIHKSPPEYLNWISHLPSSLQNEIVQLTLPCSILVQKEKVCLSEGPGLAATLAATL